MPLCFPPLFLASISFLVYLLTTAPTFTWRNGGADSAELATAAYVWGVAHPPGYPLYLTVVRVFQYLPFGDAVYRATLVSVFSAAVAVGLVYATVIRLVGARPHPLTSSPVRLERGDRPRGGRAVVPSSPSPVRLERGSGGEVAAFTSLLFAFSPLLWSQAVVAEVYTFGAALFGLSLYCAVRWLDRPTTRRTAWLALGLGLLIGHQPTAAVALVPMGWCAWKLGWRRRSLLVGSLPLLVVPLLFLTLWLRAAFDPVLNWGDPSTLDRWLVHVQARLYRGYFLARPAFDELPRLPYAVNMLVRQLGWPGVVLAALGLAWLWSERRLFAALASSLALFFLLFAVLYNARDSEIYVLPAAQILALAAGVGAWSVVSGQWLGGRGTRSVGSGAPPPRSAPNLTPASGRPSPARLERGSERHSASPVVLERGVNAELRAGPWAGGEVSPPLQSNWRGGWGVRFVLLTSLAWQLWTTWPAVDLSRDREARDWAEAALRDAPPGAILRSTADHHTFPLWYLQMVEGRRPDVAIVDDRLLPFDWYLRQLLRRYPQLAGQAIADPSPLVPEERRLPVVRLSGG